MHGGVVMLLMLVPLIVSGLGSEPVRFWSLRETALFLGIPESSFRKTFRRWRVPFHKFGSKSIRFDAEDIRQWAAARRQAPEPGTPTEALGGSDCEGPVHYAPHAPSLRALAEGG